MKEVLDQYAPFKYIDNSGMSGKIITKIGVMVKNVTSASGEQPFMTVYKIKTSVDKNFDTQGTAIKVYFPADTQANTWAYADCNIELEDDETIAFGAQSGDTMNWGFLDKGTNNFKTNAGLNGDATLIFDIYVKEANSWNNHLINLAEKESTAPLRGYL